MHPSVLLFLSALLPAVAGHGIPLPRFLGGGRNVPSFSFPFDFHHHNHAVETPPTNSATPDPSGPAPVGPAPVDPAPVGPAPVGPSTVGPAPEATIPARAVDGMCGPSYGSCPAGQCCSLSGYCGTGTPYCAAPDCQINFGPACDGNQKPSGADTSNIARPKNGNVLYGGVGIIDCVNNGEIAITFDDGPYLYTSQLLDVLQANNVRATFFMTGNNLGKGMINDPSTPYPAIIKRMVANGHQIASHSWSHQNASTLTTAQLTNQIIWNEIAFNSILGYFPTYWRPPYSICNTACSTLLAKYGYHVTYLDLDTMGYVYPNDMTIPKSLWDQAIAVPPTDNSWLQDEHDVVQQVVSTLVPYMLSTLAASGYTPVTLGQCLNDAPANWYRAGTGTVPPYTFKPYNPSATPSPTASPSSVFTTSTPTAAPSPAPTGPLKVSSTGQCSNGLTCQGSTFGNCCSVNGWCGTTAAYCGTGCQAAFGTCTTTTGGGTSVSTTGQCGNGLTCKGSTFGNCCSVNGWCGTTAAYCGTGCQAAFGTCT